MSDALRVGVGPVLLRIPRWIWGRVIRRTARTLAAQVAHIPDRLKRERDLAVSEIVRTGRPVRPETIAAALELAPELVRADLEDLERKMIFLHRDREGAVEWAYPVTASRTPHRVRWEDGLAVQAA
ncbi:MAG: hypothetical protein HYY06_32805 [Deltaproteobacteria bacterium]|nr:hypothetical protein [Deltaproteobacteria bacterium]